MKKKCSVMLLPLILMLASCGNTGNDNNGNNSGKNTSSHSSEKTNHKPTDAELSLTDDYLYYDNFIKMNGNQETADPFVFRFNGKYYLYPTTSGGAVKCYVSENMYEWEPCDNGSNATGYCYEYSDDGASAPSSRIPFAPEVAYFNGYFYMITSPSGNGHYILRAENPDGPYECITDNLGRSIDGSFFITDDEEIIMYGAGSGSILAYELNDDFMTFAENDSGESYTYSINEARMGGWNEGPYLLERYGKYYLTFTGTHYLNRDYRIDYCYGDIESDPKLSSAFKRQGNIALETGDSFYGLGHSCTVLGPDMDSYYLAYHNLTSSTSRYLNFSRLAFDGSSMVTNFVRPDDCVGTDLPPFYATSLDEYPESGNYYMSSEASEDAFTVEFNNIGEGEMIFSYVNDSEYAFIRFMDNKLTVNKVEKGIESQIAEATLNHEFTTDAYHTYRLQYKEGRMVLYFDNMTKVDTTGVSLKGGKVGYSKNNAFTDIGYTAFSNVALGSSDSKAYSDEISLARNYDESLSYLNSGSELVEQTSSANFNKVDSHYLKLANEGDFATYRMFAHDEGDTTISLRIPSQYVTSSFEIRIDGGEVIYVQLDSQSPEKDNGDTLVDIYTGEIAPGAHNITIVNTGDELQFSELRYDQRTNGESVSYDFTTDSYSDLIQRDNGDTTIAATKNGLESQNDSAFGVLTQELYDDVTVETTMKVNSIESTGFAGIVIGVQDYSIEFDDKIDPNNYNGYQLAIQSNKAAIKYADFEFTSQVKGGKFRYTEGETYDLKAVKNNNRYQFYIDGDLIIDYTANIGTLYGQVGLFSHNADVVYQNLIITV